jgi:hypothetical protein
LHSERWTKEVAEGVQFTVGNYVVGRARGEVIVAGGVHEHHAGRAGGRGRARLGREGDLAARDDHDGPADGAAAQRPVGEQWVRGDEPT